MKSAILTLVRKFEIDGDYYVQRPSGLRKKILRILILIQIYIEFFCDSRSQVAPDIKIYNSKLRQFLGEELMVSPSRIACINFILNNENIFSFNQNLNVLDIGCGDGQYSNLFRTMRGEKSFHYMGVDIVKYENWKHVQSKNIEFLQSELPNKDVLPKLQFRNLIFSQSSLEHIRNAEEIVLWLCEKLPKVRQFHLVPAAASGFNYLAHGFRRYTFLDLVKLGEKSGREYKITPIGGRDCYHQYFKFYNKVTKLRHRYDHKGMFQTPYEPKMNLKDICSVQDNEYPIFYAFEIL
ncbi:class I SAM-dependent methyltransferase [Alphaproteobacteria bacterium]|nr:class I SAM-dependent methyltransferase [Alphaproteobacteria bacterium]